SASVFRTESCPPARPNSASSWGPGRCRPLTWTGRSRPLQPPRNEVQGTRRVRIHPPERPGALRGLDVSRPGGGDVKRGALEGAVRGVLAEVDLGQHLPVG